MADRSGAAMFGRIFNLLMKADRGELPPSLKETAEQFYEETRSYDFNGYQMGCDEALQHFGLAEERTDSDGRISLRYKGEY